MTFFRARDLLSSSFNGLLIMIPGFGTAGHNKDDGHNGNARWTDPRYKL